ncbi:hypothetical protein [Aurantiacibacter sp. MUD61]|uniref:hypothetical protein n=1 Tax=Aurantiacibacter sp. MUD61 TaxID=3009083 RepID=UPI0022F0F48A|nr:hypothetical protein [Aurantiacibacter sp. MUD61]
MAAPLLLLQGHANAEMGLGPLSWNGFWQADISRAFLQGEQAEDGTFSVSVREGGEDLAVNAWRQEPLATDGLFLVAVQMREDGELDQFERLISVGSDLDKRNRLLATLQLEKAVLDDDLDAAFPILDRIAMAHPSLVPDMISSIKQVLVREGTVEPLRRVLETEPVWVGQFWNGVPPQPEALRRLYQLRQQTDVGTSDQSDAILIGGLVNAGFYGDALDLWRESIAGENAAPFAFRQDAEFPPISWQLVSTGQRALSARGEGRYELYAQQYSDGEVARQLLQLEPGRYRLSADISPANAAERVEARLFCATGNGDDAEPRALDSSAVWEVSGDCDAYWLVLDANAWEQRSALRATITNFSFEAI